MTLKIQWLGRPFFVPQMVGMKLLEMLKDMKIKQSVSTTPKSMGGFFSLKNAFHARTNLFGQTYGGIILHGVQ